MSGTVILARPIRAKLSAEAHLLEADQAILDLHYLAGGVEGGELAVPGLARMVRQTARLRMGLARRVTVTDGRNATEYWVESSWRHDAVHIAILSERALLLSPNHLAQRNSDIDWVDGHVMLETDAAGRVIACNGDLEPEFERQAIGQSVNDIVVLDDIQTQRWQQLRQNAAGGIFEPVGLWPKLGIFRLETRPLFSSTGGLSGYRMMLEPLAKTVVDTPVTSPTDGSGGSLTPTALQQDTALPADFGNLLAPALRQPLHRIIANAETIGTREFGALRDGYAVYARDIAEAARHLSSLVEDIADLEAVERPGFVTAKDEVDLADMARRVSGLLALKAADHSMQLEIVAPKQNIIAEAEFRRVLQILLNLVTNAIRYAPDGGMVTMMISADSAQHRAAISVHDQGEGVPEENREQVFQKFERLGRSGDGGTGLGLYISRQLARAMGGDIVITDTPDGGACFTLHLPLQTQHITK